MSINRAFFYWYCREQSLVDRAMDISRFLTKLEFVIAVDEWQTTSDQIIRVKDIESTISTLLSHFKKEIKRHYKVKEVDDSFSEDIGSVLTLKSISAQIKMQLNFMIGGCHKNIPNSLIIQGLKPEVLLVKSCFTIGIEHFNVDWATVTDSNFVSENIHKDEDEIWVGWMVFISNKITFNLVGLNCTIKRLTNGNLLTITETEFDPTNPLHVEKAINVADYFRANNISRNTFYIISPQDL